MQVYLFVTLLSIPESSFNVAFKMFDLDHNGYVIFQLLDPFISIFSRGFFMHLSIWFLFSYFNLISSEPFNCYKHAHLHILVWIFFD